MGKIRFGTDGGRGITAEDFTFAALRKVSGAVAAYINEENLQSRGIVIGYDTRFLAERFAAVVAEEMQKQGIKVYFCTEATPTPVVAFGILHKKAGGAVMLTASHNPPEYMGFKFIPQYAGPALPQITDRITALLESGEIFSCPPGCGGKLEEVNFKDSYFDYISSRVNLGKIKDAGLRFVVDPMHGAGIGYLEGILSGLGLDILALHNWRDPLFGGSMPEPREDLLIELIARVRSEHRDMGLALDGDADRFGIVDSLGRYISPNQVLCLLFRYLAEVRGLRGPVARTVATTTLLDRMARNYGLDVIETPVGFKYQGQAMLNQGAILAGEESGGLSVLGHVPEKDGILACLLMAEVTAYYGKPLSQVLEDIYDQYGHVHTQRLDFRCPAEKKQTTIELLEQFAPSNIHGVPVLDIITIDGWKYLLADGSWLLVRASGTEPVFRIYGEAKDKDTLSQLQQSLANLLELAD